MADINHAIIGHYSSGLILQRIEDALRHSGVDPDRPSPADLAPIDNLHGRGVVATREHVAAAGISSDHHVLDIGCGVGGPARLMANEIGCRVTGIDLTEEYISVARELTRRCDLSDRADFEQGDATELPFDDAAFDHVYCHNVTMNIEDKAGLAGEIHRVLKPGGRYSCAEVALGPTGAPHFPLPWARTPETSFLVSPEEMRSVLEQAGFQVIRQDENADSDPQARLATAKPAPGAGPSGSAATVMGDDMRERTANAARSAGEGRLIDQFILAARG